MWVWHQGHDGGMAMMEYGGMGGWAWIWMTAGVLFWVVVVALVASAFSRTGTDSSRPPGAEEILRQRYASGEISEQEFETRRQALRRS